MFSLSLLAEVKVWEEVTVERVESIWIFINIEEAVDSHDIPVVFYMRVAERDLLREKDF